MNRRIILNITNACNLKCSHCIYGCDLIDKPYYITVEEFQTTINHIKRLTKNEYQDCALTLSGGDPLTHPQFIDLCKIARQILPSKEISVYTNGLLLNKFTDKELKFLNENLHIYFLISLYPVQKNLSIYKQIFDRFKQLNLCLYTQSSHIYFTKVNFISPLKPNLHLIEHDQKCLSTLTYNNDLIICYKDKLYPCCGEIGFINGNLSQMTNNCLNINEINSLNEVYEFSKIPHNICQYCNLHSVLKDETILWQPSKNITHAQYLTTLEDAFIQDYATYTQFALDATEHYNCFKDDFFRSKFDDQVNPGEFNYCNQKFLTGDKDLLIIVNSLQPKNVKDILLKQNLTTTNIYLCILTTDKNLLKNYYATFKTIFMADLSVTLLRASNSLEAYKQFKLYSYLPHKQIIQF